MSHTTDQDGFERQKLNTETALINWHELQTYFAAGQVTHVSTELNLLDVATVFLTDNKALASEWIEKNLISMVADEQAKVWFDDNTTLWAVVIQPFVLVQEQSESDTTDSQD